MSISTILSSTTWGVAAGKINDNFITLITEFTKNVAAHSESAGTTIPTFISGDSASCVTIDFGSVENDDMLVVNGVVTLKVALSTAVSLLSLHLQRAGGGQASELLIWVESSVDSGSTWVATPNTLRQVEIASNGEGFISMEFGQGQASPADAQFRLRATNDGGGTLEYFTPSTIDTGNGDASSFSALLDISYTTVIAIV